jgi:hypothetical protein
MSEAPLQRKLQIRNAALGLATVALVFYFGIIVLFFVRGHH